MARARRSGGTTPRRPLDLYAWYEEVESDLVVLRRDVSVVAAHAEALAETDEATRELADDLARGWPRRKAVRAVIGHALEFETWRSLVRRQGLSRKLAVDAMTTLVFGLVPSTSA